MIEQFKAKLEPLPKLRVAKLQIVAVLQLIDAEGNVMEECPSQPLIMYPGKFMEFKDAVTKIEIEANKDTISIEALIKRSLW